MLGFFLSLPMIAQGLILGILVLQLAAAAFAATLMVLAYRTIRMEDRQAAELGEYRLAPSQQTAA